MNILFDFDGTLAQSLELILESYHDCAPKYRLKPLDAAMVETLRAKGAREMFKLSGLSLLQIPFFIDDIRNSLAKRIATAPVVPNLPPILLQLREAGHKLGIVTSNTAENVQAFLTQHGLASYFAFIQSENDLWGKGAALRRVLSQHRLVAAETIYIGDESRDVEAAKEAGLKVAAVTWGFNFKPILQAAKPDFLLDHPTELLKIVEIS